MTINGVRNFIFSAEATEKNSTKETVLHCQTVYSLICARHEGLIKSCDGQIGKHLVG